MPSQSHLSKAKILATPTDTPYHALFASPRASPARSWQQMMRARLGIDKTKSWADWAEEEEEAAEPTKTLADAKSEVATEGGQQPLLSLSMRLRGGGPDGDASAHGQDGSGGGALTEGGPPRHASAHGQEGGDDGTLTEGGPSLHVSAHGQDGGGDGTLTEGGLPLLPSAPQQPSAPPRSPPPSPTVREAAPVAL